MKKYIIGWIELHNLVVEAESAREAIRIAQEEDDTPALQTFVEVTEWFEPEEIVEE